MRYSLKYNISARRPTNAVNFGKSHEDECKADVHTYIQSSNKNGVRLYLLFPSAAYVSNFSN